MRCEFPESVPRTGLIANASSRLWRTSDELHFVRASSGASHAMRIPGLGAANWADRERV